MMRERRSAHNSGDKYLLVCSCHLGGRLCRSAVKEIAHRPPYGTRQLIDLAIGYDTVHACKPTEHT